MGLVRTWSRQVARAAGASIIAPLALLLAAGVGARGAGRGGLASLGRIASGPSLPDTGRAPASRSSTQDAAIVGADVPVRGEAKGPAPPAAELASATPTTPPSRPAEPAGAGMEIEGGSPAERPRRRSPLIDTGQGAGIDGPEPKPPPSGNPVDRLEETTRGLGESLSRPLRPVGGQLLDLLRRLGPPPR